MNRVLLLIIGVGLIWSCKKDDGPQPEIVPPRTLAEVIAEDDAEITAYLQTHFYNYEEFESPPADFDYKIVIDTIAGENADKTPLSNQMTSKTIKRSASHFGLSTGEDDIEHTMYYLEARQGIGETLSVADSTYVRYEGSLLNGTVFDGANNAPVWFDLAQIQSPQGGARGFTEGTAELRAGGDPIINDDGTFDVEGYGAGLIIFPSGLGYFNATPPNIPAYSPLIFKVEVFAVNKTDHDGDGIPSIDEDLDGDGYLYNDNTDAAFEDANNLQRFVNFIDVDDDGDDTSTRDEITDDAGNIIIPYPDSDGDGIPDYLDADS